jgi:hypothetical protein
VRLAWPRRVQFKPRSGSSDVEGMKLANNSASAIVTGGLHASLMRHASQCWWMGAKETLIGIIALSWQNDLSPPFHILTHFHR